MASMHPELISTANLITHTIRMTKNPLITESRLKHFRNNLYQLLERQFMNHWFPQNPNKGTGYRCIRIYEKNIDPFIVEAGKGLCNFDINLLHETLPFQLIIWINPREVTFQVNQNMSTYVLYSYFRDKGVPWKPKHSNSKVSIEIKNVIYIKSSWIKEILECKADLGKYFIYQKMIKYSKLFLLLKKTLNKKEVNKVICALVQCYYDCKVTQLREAIEEIKETLGLYLTSMFKIIDKYSKI